ncbi:MAG: hypothetical protein AAF849_18035 [Bacteroidota bacterium]
MKKSLLFVLALSISMGLSAQNEDYKNVLTLNIGASLPGTLFDLFDNNNLNEFEIDVDGQISNVSGQFVGRSAPAIQVNYDYGIVKWFSVGGGLSYQNMGFEIQNLSYLDEDEALQKGVDLVDVGINRINIGIRPLFHYGNNDKLDLYSGFRIGLTSWITDVTASDTNIQNDIDSTPFAGVNLAFQVIPFALRGYFSENFGINFETGIGAPHYFSLGLNYRL